jgi:hypothetical protein
VKLAPLRTVAVPTLALVLILTACSSHDAAKKATHTKTSPSSTATTSSPPPPPQPSRLSGRMGKPNGPVYAVKVDNTRNAHPQQGLTRADVVYVEQVEGGATRLAAVFSSAYPQTVGPVRSARITDIDLLRQYGNPVGLFYSGSQNKLADNLRRADLKLVSFDQDHSGYVRSPSRHQPYDVIGNFAALRKRAGKVATPPVMGYTCSDTPPPGGKPTKQVTVSFPFSRVDATWAPAQKVWQLSMDGSPDMAAEGGRLGATTFVVQYVTVKPSVYHDINGVNTPQTLTVGQGKALFFRNGQEYVGAWSRPKASAVTTYTIGGQPASFAPGQIWVALFDRTRQAVTR